MENKKDIGKLFKAKLDGLDKSPNENLWAAINEELQEKKKRRRIIPFYFYYSGVAVLLLFLGFATKSLWLPIFEGSDKVENNLDIDSQTNKTTLDFNDAEVQMGNSSENNLNSIEDEESLNSIKDEAISITSEKDQDENGFNSKVNKNDNPSVKNSKSNPNRKGVLKTAVANSPKPEKNISNTISRKQNNNNNGGRISKGENPNSKYGSDNSILKTNTETEILNRTGSEIDEFFKNYKLKSTKDSLEIAVTGASENSKLENKQDSTKVDSLAIKRKAKVELRLAAQKKLDSIEAAKPKYYVFAQAAVSAFDHFGKQSFIDPRLENYDITTELQYNYGIYFGFIANDKLNLRIGLNKASLSLTTKNVPLISQNPNTAISGYFSNVDYNTALSNEQLAEYLGASNVTLTQNVRFVEIPLEAKYKVYDGIIGLEAIGGISTLFLSKNELKAEANNKFLYLGKVNNGRQASASLNLGAGFNYKIGKNLQLNVEPMFKYYFRSFEVANKPYSLNLRAGLQYNFSELFKNK